MKNCLNSITALFFYLSITSLTAQQTAAASGAKVYNFTSFLPDVERKINTNLQGQITDHPEFGFLPFDAPCKDCFEIIEKRTPNTRY